MNANHIESFKGKLQETTGKKLKQIIIQIKKLLSKRVLHCMTE